MEVYMNQLVTWLSMVFNTYTGWIILVPFSIFVVLGMMGKIVIYKNFSETISSPLLYTASMMFFYAVVYFYMNHIVGPHTHVVAVRITASIPLMILIVREIIITFNNNDRNIFKAIMALCVRLPLSLILAFWITFVLLAKSTKDDADAGVLKVIPFIAILLMVMTTRDKCLSDHSAEIVNKIYRQITGNTEGKLTSMFNL